MFPLFFILLAAAHYSQSPLSLELSDDMLSVRPSVTRQTDQQIEPASLLKIIHLWYNSDVRYLKFVNLMF